jgi:hypothetical protein
MGKACLCVMRPTSYKLLKYRTDGDCLHSVNAPASVLEDPRSGKLGLVFSIITDGPSHFDPSLPELSV